MKKTSKIQIARNYAAALYNAASETGQFDEVFKDCALLSNIFADMPELKYLKNPVWKTEQKQEVINQIVKKLQLSPITANFLNTVNENSRLDDLQTILQEFKHIFYQKQNIKEVIVESAQALSASQDKKLNKALEKALRQKVTVDYIIKPELLGGLIVRSGSLRIDDSLTGKLQRLEQVMKGKL